MASPLSVIRKKHENFKPLVYVCFKESDNRLFDFNLSIEYARIVYEGGGVPITPYLQFIFLDKKNELFNKILLGKCQEVWVFGNSDNIPELEIAKRRNMVIKYVGG